MLENWNNRNPIVANLLNPAFCGELLRCALKGYKKEKNYNMDYALCFIILPILLHKSTYQSLPKTTRKKFFEWYEQSKSLKVNLAERIRDMVPFTRESICFLLYYGAIEINSSTLLLLPYKKKKSLYSQEILEYYRKAELFGKWLAKSGTTQTIYATLGIKP